jgi:hypothetical protein
VTAANATVKVECGDHDEMRPAVCDNLAMTLDVAATASQSPPFSTWFTLDCLPYMLADAAPRRMYDWNTSHHMSFIETKGIQSCEDLAYNRF